MATDGRHFEKEAPPFPAGLLVVISKFIMVRSLYETRFILTTSWTGGWPNSIVYDRTYLVSARERVKVWGET